jgi:hypothetical protein
MGSLTIVNMAAAAAAPASTGGIGPIISVIAAGLTGYTAIRKFAEGLQEPITAPVPAAPRP